MIYGIIYPHDWTNLGWWIKFILFQEEIVTLKENCDPNDFFKYLPREFEQIYNHIKSLQYEDEPDYAVSLNSWDF